MTEAFETGIHFIKFGADWCAPCRQIEPVLNNFEESNINRVNVHKINIDIDSELATKFNIRNIPSIVIIKDGKIIDRMVGAQTIQTLTNKLNDVESI
jgi:thioredoxin 1